MKHSSKVFFLLSICLLYACSSLVVHAQGTAWEHVYFNPKENREFIAVASNNTRFVALGYGRLNYTSSDGLRWEAQSDVSTSYFALTFGNGKFVGVGFAGSIITSDNGITWSKRTSGVTSYFTGVTYAADKNWFVAIAVQGQIAVSKDGGNTWTKSVDPSLLANDITYGNGRFVMAGGSGNIYHSLDGVNWTNKKIGTKHLMCATYGNGTFVVAGHNEIYSSTDGINWSRKVIASNAFFHGATYTDFASGNMFVVVGELLSGTNVPVYTSSDGISWTSRTSNAGSHLFTVASKGNSQRIVAMGVLSTIVQSDNIAPKITVTNPKFPSGFTQMILKIGTTFDITWNVTGSVGNIKLEYSTTGGGGNYTTIDDSVPAANGTYSWTVPNKKSTNCIIRVSETDGAPLTHSRPFTISDGSDGTITVTSPNGGETLIVGKKHTIKWNSTGAVGDVKLWYAADDVYTKIEHATANDGSYEWTVPNNPSTKCKVRVSESSDGAPNDESNNYFTIAKDDDSSITITAPVGGETLIVGTKYTIEWSSTGSVGDVKLWSAVDDVYTKIEHATANDGSYEWTVPNKSSNECRIRISETSDGYPNDETSNFSIAATPTDWINVTSPNGGEILEAGSSHNITWTHSGTVGNLKIEYSTNGGSSYSTVMSSTANDGTHNWTVPNVDSSTCTVRLSEASDGSPVDTSDGLFTIVDNTPPEIVLDKTRLNFGYIRGGAAPCLQSLFIYNGGGGTLNWTAGADAGWINLDPASGTGGNTVTVSIDTSGLSTGGYSGTITVDDSSASNSPQTVAVYLTVKNSSQDQLPFGVFSTPVDGTTNVAGSIAVTGWVLDDICVESVKINREVGGSLSYIGDAVFVEGARPDVAEAHPDYPNNSRAGWGYMMLTNYLPDGVLVLKPVAVDSAGHQVVLGTATITVDNEHAVKPFGAIDTPAQGGGASDNKYRNAGWTLTPNPNKIPENGSTIKVYIDGVFVGNPYYNLYRADIAALFPGYTNTNGAHGYLDIDTTAYTNGVHTISWGVSDNAGNSDGIGSRYFTIQNTGAGSGNAASRKSKPMLIVKPSVLIRELSRIPVNDSEPIRIKKGFKQNINPQEILPDEKGVINVRIRELEPIEIDLGDNFHSYSTLNRGWAGYLVKGDKLSLLPIGSTLDSKTGTFYWQPGHGFFGCYEFVFIGKCGNGKLLKRRIRIEVTSKFSAK